ncbi:MAG: CDP-alcohol phosphatidyltransferase family protein [Rhodospirillaceae bacterium]|nr:CDP-alcohol phosphatidyltransferase family protein [Rhodospirillaceae bacterium]
MTKHRNLPFPIIRHLSRRLTPVLLRLPISANQITLLSLVVGIWPAWLLSTGTYDAGIQASFVLLLTYILDHCDGEVARAKNQASDFGANFDSFVDWVVHSLFFAGLGYGQALVRGEKVWFWLGIAAALGASINYFLVMWFKSRDRKATAGEVATEDNEPVRPSTALGWAVFFFRELSRADFCFLVLILALLDGLWLLLPAGAIGAQVYWMGLFIREAREYRV